MRSPCLILNANALDREIIDILSGDYDMTGSKKTKSKKLLSSILDTDAERLSSPAIIRAVENAMAEFGITKTVRVPTASEQKTTYSVRTTKDVQRRLQEYAYIERLTIGDAVEKLLDLAEKQQG
jgi:hypothetical protein